MSPISLNPMHYIALGAIILIGGLLGYSWTIKTRLEVCTARSEAFVANTKAAAQQQIALNAQESVKRESITRKLENDNAKLQSDIAQQYADYKRLLNARANTRRVSPIPNPSEGRESRPDEAKLTEAMDGFERRRIEILEQGDKAIAEAITLEDWLDQQSKVE